MIDSLETKFGTPGPQAGASVSERAWDMLFAQYLRSGSRGRMSEEKAGRLTAHVRETQPECLRAIEQALTQQRGEVRAGYIRFDWQTGDPCKPWDSKVITHDEMRQRYADALSRATTPQPDAEDLRELVQRWKARPGVTDAYKICADELESLLARGGAK